MKHFLLAVTLTLISTFSFSQSYLQKGGNQLNLGVGFSNWGVPVYFGFDHSISNDITLGLEASYRSYKDNPYKHNIFGFSGNGNYHLNRVLKIPKNFDLYGGLNIGFYSWSSPDNYKGIHKSGLGLGAQIGGRVNLSQKVGLNLEFGGGNAFSGGKFGLTIKV